MIVRNTSIILFVFISLGLSVSANAKLSQQDVFSLFKAGNEAFRQANSLTNTPDQAKKLYEKAILSYEKIINDGEIKNAKLYYNLANAYFLSEQLGKAILNYRRAEKLDNTNPDIRKNLTFARSQRIDKVELKTEKRILQTLFFWHYDFSLKTKFVLTCIFFAVVCISITVMIWFGRIGALTVTAFVFGILTVCFFVSVLFQAGEQAREVCGVITAGQVVARQGDSQNYPPSFKEPLHAGTEFGLIERRAGWFHIRLSDDSDGWIPDVSAELI